MEWTDDAIARLRALWAEGHSTAEIGRRMGVSKNAVVGKAHRLGLEARPSPIRREEEAAAARPAQLRRVVGPTLPALAAVSAAVPAVPAGVRMAPAPMTAGPRARTCCWPLGEPGTVSFRFCGAEALPGKPYCAEHAAVAYVKMRDRHEDAA
jgi:GcrA cell cycle regulator